MGRGIAATRLPVGRQLLGRLGGRGAVARTVVIVSPVLTRVLAVGRVGVRRIARRPRIVRIGPSRPTWVTHARSRQKATCAEPTRARTATARLPGPTRLPVSANFRPGKPQPEIRGGGNGQLKEDLMIALGIILLLLGFMVNVQIVWSIGVILLVIGAVLWIFGAVGRPVAGRRYWY